MQASAEGDDLARFLAARPRLLSISYRIVGSAAEAEDVVQDAYLRWQKAPRDQVDSAEAFLVRTVTNLSLDKLDLAHKRRELYVGEWLPEPVGDAWEGYSADMDSVSLAFMVLLERLSPLERAVFVLHSVMDFDHQEIAKVIGRSEEASRQLLRRAKEHIAAGRARFKPDPEEHSRLLGAFIRAAQEGDLDALKATLAERVRLVSDGGGRVPATLRPLEGADAVAKFILAQMKNKQGLVVSVEAVNGWPAIVARTPEGKAVDVLDVVTHDGRIGEILAVRNPDKLKFMGPSAPPGPSS